MNASVALPEDSSRSAAFAARDSRKVTALGVPAFSRLVVLGNRTVLAAAEPRVRGDRRPRLRAFGPGIDSVADTLHADAQAARTATPRVSEGGDEQRQCECEPLRERLIRGLSGRSSGG